MALSRLRSWVLWPVLVGSAVLVPAGIALALLADRAQREGAAVAASQPQIVAGSIVLAAGLAGIDLGGGLLVAGTPRLGWWRALGVVLLLIAVAWWAFMMVVGLPTLSAEPPPFWALLWNLPPAALAWIVGPTAALLVGGVLAHLADVGARHA